MHEDPKEEAPLLEAIEKSVEWRIPDCCREGWENCPHVAQRPKPKKSNIGL